MARRAGDHYPLLLERLRADGASTDEAAYARCGLVSIGVRESEDAWFAPFADRVIRRSGGRVREITPQAASALFPPLGPVHRALHYADAARIDGRGMADALRRASENRGVRFVFGTVSAVTWAGDSRPEAPPRRAQQVTIDGHESLQCGALVVAGGAWSATLGRLLSCPLPITPTKGQIVHLETTLESDGWPIIQPLLTHYLVPWPGGRVACGGTFETAAGFSSTVTASGLLELLRECLTVAPGLAGAAYLFTKVGLRPTSSDDRPVVGALPGWGNVWVATGHGANGLLLGPYTASLLAAELADASAGKSGSAEASPPRIPGELNPARFS
jgi:D-amino-acid dehydrogenase